MAGWPSTGIIHLFHLPETQPCSTSRGKKKSSFSLLSIRFLAWSLFPMTPSKLGFPTFTGNPENDHRMVWVGMDLKAQSIPPPPTIPGCSKLPLGTSRTGVPGSEPIPAMQNLSRPGSSSPPRLSIIRFFFCRGFSLRSETPLAGGPAEGEGPFPPRTALCRADKQQISGNGISALSERGRKSKFQSKSEETKLISSSS